MPAQTNLGRVQPLYKGEYNSNEIYEKLDNILYNGSTYVSLQYANMGHQPDQSASWWQLIAEKGEKGEPGGYSPIQAATATSLPYGSSPEVTTSIDTSSEQLKYNFHFGIPAGPAGIDSVVATASSAAPGASPSVEVSLDSNRVLSLAFGIPQADGSGIVSIDSNPPDENRNYQLSDKYIAIPSNKYTGEFLIYNGDGWGTQSVRQVPADGSDKQVLRKITNGYAWQSSLEVPIGGLPGAVLTKTSQQDTGYTWVDPIKNTEIDAIFNS